MPSVALLYNVSDNRPHLWDRRMTDPKLGISLWVGMKWKTKIVQKVMKNRMEEVQQDRKELALAQRNFIYFQIILLAQLLISYSNGYFIALKIIYWVVQLTHKAAHRNKKGKHEKYLHEMLGAIKTIALIIGCTIKARDCFPSHSAHELLLKLCQMTTLLFCFPSFSDFHVLIKTSVERLSTFLLLMS